MSMGDMLNFPLKLINCLCWVCCCPCMTMRHVYQESEHRARTRGFRLCLAAERNNWFEVNRILTMHPAEANSQFPYPHNGKTILMDAAEKGNIRLLSMLLDHGADIDRRDDRDATALIYAARAGQVEAIKVLCAKNANLSFTARPIRETAIIAAASRDNSVAFETLLNFGGELYAEHIHPIDWKRSYLPLYQAPSIAPIVERYGKKITALLLGKPGLHADVACFVLAYLALPSTKVASVEKDPPSIEPPDALKKEPVHLHFRCG